MSCLETACVTGYKRVPEPPAKIMPLRVFIVHDFATVYWFIKAYAFMLALYVLQ